MGWILPTIGANVLFALGSTNDKAILTRYMKSTWDYLILANVLAMVIAFVLLPIVSLPGLWILGLLALNGFVSLGALYLWFLALGKEDVSRNAVMLNLIPVFTAILSFLILNEAFPEKKLLGVSLMILAGILASINPRQMSLSKALPLVVLSALGFGISNIIVKLAVSQVSPATAYFWTRFFMGMPLLPVIPRMFRNIPKKAVVLISGNESLFLVGTVMQFWAIQISSPTLVASLGSVYPTFVLVFEAIYAGLLPWFKADFDRVSTALKIISLGILIPGVWLVS